MGRSISPPTGRLSKNPSNFNSEQKSLRKSKTNAFNSSFRERKDPSSITGPAAAGLVNNSMISIKK